MKAKDIIGTKCTQGQEISVLNSYAGYYIGCMKYDDEMGCEMPQCRLTTEYTKNREKALDLDVDRLNASENLFCCNSKGCIQSQR